ncbi:MAG: ClbS/DfsB family four-helix bundle protein [Candidatus Babeliales bacterium]
MNFNFFIPIYEFKASLSIEICKEYNNLIQLIAAVNHPQYDKIIMNGTGDNITIRDLIAYQIGWGNLLISWYNAGITNEHMSMPGEGFNTWNYKGLAHLFYVKYKYSDINEQLSVLHNTVHTILIIVEQEYKNNNLDACGIWQWCTLKSGKEWPLSKWIRINTVAPYKRATALIKKHFLTKT